MKAISFPDNLEYAQFYDTYISKVNKNDKLLAELNNSAKQLKAAISQLTEEQLMYKYAPGKWCIKDILMHMIDVERVFLYRAMRFARLDKTPLPFFDEDAYANVAAASKMTIKSILAEFMATRKASITFYNNLPKAAQKHTGIASQATMSVRATAWIIYGHQLHHWGVIQQKYLNK